MPPPPTAKPFRSTWVLIMDVADLNGDLPVESDDKWLIYTPKNRIDIDEYPAVREHLRPFKDRLERRATKQKWFELQQAQASCEAWFRQEKLVYPEQIRCTVVPTMA